MPSDCSQRANALRWRRQLMLYRYSVLVAQLKRAFPMTEEQQEAIEKRILNIEWIDSAFVQAK